MLSQHVFDSLDVALKKVRRGRESAFCACFLGEVLSLTGNGDEAPGAVVAGGQERFRARRLTRPGAGGFPAAKWCGPTHRHELAYGCADWPLLKRICERVERYKFCFSVAADCVNHPARRCVAFTGCSPPVSGAGASRPDRILTVVRATFPRIRTDPCLIHLKN
jgi:hypothetical protein